MLILSTKYELMHFTSQKTHFIDNKITVTDGPSLFVALNYNIHIHFTAQYSYSTVVSFCVSYGILRKHLRQAP